MNDDERCLAIGAYINGALYLIGIFVGGLMTHEPWVWRAAIASAGVSFLCYVVQLGRAPRIVAAFCVGTSIALALAGGIWLLIGGIK
jgi:hypothetical protein